jgi:isoleucyl-tRNA synthetase
MLTSLRFTHMLTARMTEQVSKACEKYTLPVADADSKCFVGVKKAGGHKCERCWFYSDEVGTHEGLDNVCPRCASAVVAKGGLPEPAGAQ